MITPLFNFFCSCYQALPSFSKKTTSQKKGENNGIKLESSSGAAQHTIFSSSTALQEEKIQQADVEKIAENYKIEYLNEITAKGKTEHAKNLEKARQDLLFGHLDLASEPSDEEEKAQQVQRYYALQLATERAVHGSTEQTERLEKACDLARRAEYFLIEGKKITEHDQKKCFVEITHCCQLQAAEIAINGETERAQNLQKAIYALQHAILFLKNGEQAASDNAPTAAALCNKMADRSLRWASALVNEGSSQKTENFKSAISFVTYELQAWEKETERSYIDFSHFDESQLECLLKRAEIYETQGATAGDAFSFERYQSGK